ncbi:cytochrome P450 [Streptomyces sp. DSM 44917]|uniref:Cytochrome P450 n=1 Tax=Streptomyces boetiae TaxID=3075541 RepID=A0ABU2LBB3_9ACTN|nr:cytochrome P450 [Streptomyces sp. DSM 44917]MDT0308868.1 cytochrome P450 [Streptomyces sp. DSM 44917]
MTVTTELPQLPFPRPNVLDIAPAYKPLRDQAPLVRVRTAMGHEVWLATRYHAIKQVFGDAHFGRSHPDPEKAARVSQSLMFGGPTGEFETEEQLHRTHRKVLTPAFSPRRMRLLKDHVTQLTATMLEKLAGLTPPVDLHEHFSFPMPNTVICELIGVPEPDRDQFRVWSGRFTGHDQAAAGEAVMAMITYMMGMVADRRTNPQDDLVTDLITIAASENLEMLTDHEIADMALHLVFGGHETTVSRIDYGTLLLLRHPEQRKALVDDPSLVDQAVEEILRRSIPVDDLIPRYAREDFELEGVTIRRGECVLASTSVANMDDQIFPDPERFDIFRKPDYAHAAFGHGLHYCIGNALARTELRAVFSQLFQRFPTLELAVPFEELRIPMERRWIGGLERLPVTW